MSLFILVVFLATGLVASQSTDVGCPTQPTCDSTSTACFGYGELSITCGNGTRIGYGNCYSSELCASVAAEQTNDLISFSVSNINPKQCHSYSSQIKDTIYNAYNNWCCQGDNYLRCCPGSVAWPSGVSKTSSNCLAMTAPSDVVYLGASGSSAQTRFLIKLKPRGESNLCRLLVYTANTQPAEAGGPTTVSATGTSAASSNAATTELSSAATSTVSTTVSVASSSATPGATSKTARRRRKRSAPIGAFSLSVQTVQLMLSTVDFSSLIVSAINTASNNTLTVTVTVSQVVAPASTMSPDPQSNGWLIATGSLCGLIGVILLIYVIACSVYRSKRPSGNEALPLYM